MLLLDEPFGMLDSLTRLELQQVLLDVWNRSHITTLMVTHDVDEAIFLADRVVMMTNGPAARVGDILPIHFPRPRNRAALLEDPEYYRLREHLMTFLEERAHKKIEPNPDSSHAAPSAPPAESDSRPITNLRKQIQPATETIHA
jgi:ABC-type nitrate/sulfonate/bicarbonate transport system ATPase subunit